MQELALQRTAVDFERHGLREIALGHRADDARHFGGGLHQVADQAVDGIDATRPAAAVVADIGALVDAALLADRAADAAELAGHLLVELEDVVERVGDFAVDSGAFEGRRAEKSPLRKAERTLRMSRFLNASAGVAKLRALIDGGRPGMQISGTPSIMGDPAGVRI